MNPVVTCPHCGTESDPGNLTELALKTTSAANISTRIRSICPSCGKLIYVTVSGGKIAKVSKTDPWQT